MASKRPTVFKTTTRAASGGAVLVGVALVLLFFRGKGIGIGVDSEGQTDPSAETSEGEQRASQTPTPEFASISNPLNSPETAQPAAEGKQQPELTIDEQVAVGQKTLGILIDERSYLLKIPGTPQDLPSQHFRSCCSVGQNGVGRCQWDSSGHSSSRNRSSHC